jgi:cation:H+ antiporter
MLSTLAMAVLGVAALMYRSRRGGRAAAQYVRPQPSVVRQDLVFFLIAYPLALAAGLWHVRAFRYVLGAGLIGLYVAYVRRHLTAGADPSFEAEASGEVQPLYAIDWVRRLLRSRRPVPRKPPLWTSVGQTAFALVLIVGAARIFVDAISNVADRLGVPSLLFALLVAPVATELPEQFNGVLWLRRRRDTLAVGNVTGAMVFQSTFPVTIGLLFTPWRLSQEGLVSGLIALAAALITYSTLRLRGRLDARLMLCQALLYAGFVVYVLAVVTSNGSSS